MGIFRLASSIAQENPGVIVRVYRAGDGREFVRMDNVVYQGLPSDAVEIARFEEREGESLQSRA